jgi:hypothetical protein
MKCKSYHTTKHPSIHIQPTWSLEQELTAYNSDHQILAHPVMQFSTILPQDILRHILNHVQLQLRRERQAIIRRNLNCDCIRFPYGLGKSYILWPTCNRISDREESEDSLIEQASPIRKEKLHV